MQGTQIDIAISPAQAVIGELLAFVRRGDVAAVHSLRRGAAEALEAVVRGDRKTCRSGRAGASTRSACPRARRSAPSCAACTAATAATPAPSQARSSSPHHDTVVEPDDHVIVFVPRKRMVREVEKLFQVSATFF